jgi:hypothetical protein
MSLGRNRNIRAESPARGLRVARALLFVACACAGVAAQPQNASAQKPPTDVAPPPMRYLPPETRARLDAARDLKARTRLGMELAEERLISAAAHVEADRFDAATLELGVYAAIVRDAIDHVRKHSKSQGKTRDHFKRIELALRSHVPRLETLRRSLPSQHAVHAQTTLDFVRDSRAEVLDAFFDNMPSPRRPAPKENERATGAPAEPEKKPSDQR